MRDRRIPEGIRQGRGLFPVAYRCECLSVICVQDVFEMQAGAIQPGQNVVIIDDLIATGK